MEFGATRWQGTMAPAHAKKASCDWRNLQNLLYIELKNVK